MGEVIMDLIEVTFVAVLFYMLYEFSVIIQEQYEYEKKFFKEREKRK